MRHLKTGRKFNRSNSHRKAMLHNLTISMLYSKKIKTTLAKAKDLRRIIDKVISWGKKNTIYHRRLAFNIIRNNSLVQEVFKNIAPQYSKRNGGYLQIIKLGFRKGDSAKMVIVKLINE